jgi:hypothetical protein
VCFNELGRSPPLILAPWREISIVCFNELGRAKKPLFKFKYFCVLFFKRARCKNQHYLQTKIRFSMKETYSGVLTYPPTLGVCIAR